MLAQSSCPDAKPVKTRHIHRMAKSPEITRKELLHGAQKAVASLKKRLMDRIAETRRRGRTAQQKDRDQHRHDDGSVSRRTRGESS
jgi:hypothetical protein